MEQTVVRWSKQSYNMVSTKKGEMVITHDERVSDIAFDARSY